MSASGLKNQKQSSSATPQNRPIPVSELISGVKSKKYPARNEYANLDENANRQAFYFSDATARKFTPKDNGGMNR